MNGYQLLADSYKMLAEQGKIEKEVADKNVRVMEFLATCDKEDLCIMVDSTAFNDIIIGYMKVAVDNADIGEEEKSKVLNGIYGVFDFKNAQDVLNL